MKIKYDKDTRSYSILNQEGQKQFAETKDPKKYIFEKRLEALLSDIQNKSGLITSYKKIGESYAIEHRYNESAIICYITDDGMYVITKLDLVSGGHVGASDPTEPNAVICGPNRVQAAIETVTKLRDDFSFMRKLWRKYFG